MLDLSAERFERLVARALDLLPDGFQEHLENVSVEVVDQPDVDLLVALGMDPNDPEDTLYGLYEGVPLIERSLDGPLLPDRITIFRCPLLREATSEADVVDQVRTTVLHEIGHFFGLDEDRLEELGYG